MPRSPITPIRLTAFDRACLDAVAAALSCSRADAVRMGVRALARREGVTLPPVPPRVATRRKTLKKKRKPS